MGKIAMKKKIVLIEPILMVNIYFFLIQPKIHNKSIYEKMSLMRSKVDLSSAFGSGIKFLSLSVSSKNDSCSAVNF